MQLKRLSLFNFRNYSEATLNFSEGIHIIHGENGAGKTSILEAIHYQRPTKSSLTTTDKHQIRHDEAMFRIEVSFSDSQGNDMDPNLAYTRDQGKHLTANGQKAQKFSEYIGEVPLVLLHPADLSLSQGSPQQRRRFLDVLLSQSSKLYLHHLIQYNRSLKQRNQLLQTPYSDVNLLSSWEENLISHGTEIILKRRRTATQLSELVSSYYRELSKSDDDVEVEYKCNVSQKDDEGNLEEAYRRLFATKRNMEIENGSTMLGPHRDDLIFRINGNPMKVVASQGEHKTFVIALKLAEFQHLEQQRSEAPILLFDDIFGELDSGRIYLMLQQLGNMGQVFVTTTSANFFEKMHDMETPTHYYLVTDGSVMAEV